MNSHGPEVEVLLGLDGHFQRVPLASLAAVTHLPLADLRAATARLVLSFFVTPLPAAS